MADQNISQLDNLTASTIASGDEFAIYDADASTTKAITKTELDKAIGTVLDNTFKIADNSDNTKLVSFQVSGVTTATERTITVPDASLTLTGLDTAQTLTNKTIDPDSNTIDGDKLDIDFTPTNYTPTTTGVSEASDVDDLAAHLKGIDNALAPTSQKEFFVYPVNNTPSTGVGGFTTTQITSTQSVAFNFKTPDDFSTLTECVVVMIPDATETIQWDVTTNFAASGEAYTTNSDSITNGQASATASQIIEADMSAALTGLAAGDYIGMIFESDTNNLRVIGLQFKYNTN